MANKCKEVAIKIQECKNGFIVSDVADRGDYQPVSEILVFQTMEALVKHIKEHFAWYETPWNNMDISTPRMPIILGMGILANWRMEMIRIEKGPIQEFLESILLGIVGANESIKAMKAVCESEKARLTAQYQMEKKRAEQYER